MGYRLNVCEESDPEQALLDAYEALLESSSHMLDSARAADWDRLVEQESRYLVQVDRVKGLEANTYLDGEGRERKAGLLERLLEQDMEVRQRLVARRDELSELIGSSRRELSLSRTYGPQQASAPVDARRRFSQKSP